MKAQREKRRAVEFRNNHELHFARNVNVRGYLVRSQMEMRNMLLEIERKATLVIKWQRTWAVLCSTTDHKCHLIR